MSACLAGSSRMIRAYRSGGCRVCSRWQMPRCPGSCPWRRRWPIQGCRHEGPRCGRDPGDPNLKGCVHHGTSVPDPWFLRTRTGSRLRTTVSVRRIRAGPSIRSQPWYLHSKKPFLFRPLGLHDGGGRRILRRCCSSYRIIGLRKESEANSQVIPVLITTTAEQLEVPAALLTCVISIGIVFAVPVI